MCVCVCVCVGARLWCNAILHSSSDLSQDIKNNPLGFVSISLHCLCTPAQSTVCAPGIHTSGPDRDVGSKTSFSKWFYASSLSFYLFFLCVCSIVSDCLQPHGLLPTKLLCPWYCPGKHIGVGCHAILRGSFPTQGLNPHLFGLLHLQAGSLPLCHLGSHPVLPKTPKLWMPAIPHSILCLHRALPGTDTWASDISSPSSPHDGPRALDAET